MQQEEVLSPWGHFLLQHCEELCSRAFNTQEDPGCCSVAKSLWPHRLQHAKLPCPSPSPRVCSNLCPLDQWCFLTISSSAAPFSFCLQSFSASGSFPVSWLFASGGQEWKLHLHKSFQWIFRVDFLYECLVWSPYCSRGSQESSSTPQFKSISSSVLRLFYAPTLTSIHDYWKNHSFDYADLCRQSDISVF